MRKHFAALALLDKALRLPSFWGNVVLQVLEHKPSDRHANPASLRPLRLRTLLPDEPVELGKHRLATRSGRLPGAARGLKGMHGPSGCGHRAYSGGFPDLRPPHCRQQTSPHQVSSGHGRRVEEAMVAGYLAQPGGCLGTEVTRVLSYPAVAPTSSSCCN